MTASHQLVAAVHTLGLCTRPLLLAGFPAAAAEAGAPPLAAEELGAQPPEQARVPETQNPNPRHQSPPIAMSQSVIDLPASEPASF